jgi:hypothetical protein
MDDSGQMNKTDYFLKLARSTSLSKVKRFKIIYESSLMSHKRDVN